MRGRRARPAPRAGFLVLLLSALAAALGGCSVNPATGEWVFTAFMSEEDELELGRSEHPKIIDRFGGAYDDGELGRYVARVGGSIVRRSDLADRDFTFTVLNSDIVNAFALPGGYVYVTRGLLALAGDEAELAGVLAHEIGHVAARHAAERYSHSVVASVWVGALSAIGIPQLSDFAEYGADLYLKGYSRDQEYEADLLGVRYMTAAGYDPGAVASFLARLDRYDALQAALRGRAEARTGSFLATHPRTGARIRRVLEVVAAEGGPAARRRGVEAYLGHIDGMLYGSDPSLGFVRGSVYAHPGLGIRFEAPPGFRLINGRHRLIAKGPEGTLFLFDRARRPRPGDLFDYLVEEWAPSLELDGLAHLEINGFAAATGTARVETNVGELDLRLLAIRTAPDRIFRFMFLAPPDRPGRLAEMYRLTAAGFRLLTEEEKALLAPMRITIREAEPGDTVERLAAETPFDRFREWRFRVLNGLDRDEPLRPGRLVKVVRN